MDSIFLHQFLNLGGIIEKMAQKGLLIIIFGLLQLTTSKTTIMASMQHILFLDVETVSQMSGFDEITDHGRDLWKQKSGFMARREDREWQEEDFANSYKDRAAIYAEFGKVIVISAGIITHSN